VLAGTAAFTVYCLTAVPLLRRDGGWRGSFAALAAWAIAATVGYGLMLT
jgi:hypothetical protein